MSMFRQNEVKVVRLTKWRMPSLYPYNMVMLVATNTEEKTLNEDHISALLSLLRFGAMMCCDLRCCCSGSSGIVVDVRQLAGSRLHHELYCAKEMSSGQRALLMVVLMVASKEKNRRRRTTSRFVKSPALCRVQNLTIQQQTTTSTSPVRQEAAVTMNRFN